MIGTIKLNIVLAVFAFFLTALASGQENGLYKVKLQTGEPQCISISFKLKKHESASFQYDAGFFEQKTLNFNNTGETDTQVFKSINTATPISWSYWVLNPGNSILQYVFIAQPGDTVKLSYSEMPYLNTAMCDKKNIVADAQLSFYNSNFTPPQSMPNSKDERWAFFYSSITNRLNQEVGRINSLLQSSQIDLVLQKQLLIICKIHYYTKIFYWAFQDNGKYYKPAVDVLLTELDSIHNILIDKDIFPMSELLNVIDGIVRLQLIKKKIDHIDGVNVYNEASKTDLGKFKPDYLALCIRKNPLPEGKKFKNTVSDYRNSYKNTPYNIYIDSVVDKISAKRYIPTANKLMSLNGQTITIKDFIKTHKKFTVIDFWASWCSPCRYQLPYMDSIKKVMKNYPVDFISINIDNKQADWKTASKAEAKYLTKHNYYLQADLKSAFVKQLKIESIPRYIILNRSKIIAANFYQPIEPVFVKQLIELINSQKD